MALEEVERLTLIEALKMSNWVQTDAAELLSISPRVMNYKIKVLHTSEFSLLGSCSGSVRRSLFVVRRSEFSSSP